MKLSDIALARFRTKMLGSEPALESAGSKQSSNTKLPKQPLSSYTAPESFSSREFTTASDVYGLSMILWEIVTRYFKKCYKCIQLIVVNKQDIMKLKQLN